MKDVNPALSYAQGKSVPMYQKSDIYDAEAVALVLINNLNTLPDPIPDDAYLTLSQLMRRRDTINTHQIRLKTQLHEQLCVVYPSYKKFFSDISRQTALYFFQKYPSPDYLCSKTTEELRVPSHNNCSTKKCSKILEFIASDGVTRREYQSARNAIFREYYVRRSQSGKNNQQLIICIARRLINIVYGMLKNKTEYRDPNLTIEKSVETAV